MPKVTSVEPQKKNTKRFNIFLDGIFAFGADEDLVVEHRLVPGKIIDQSILEKLLFEAEVGKLMERMYGLFNIRQRSEKEIRDYLKNLLFKRKITHPSGGGKEKEEISEQAVELLINKLKQKRLLNDEVFAKAWVEARRRSKNKGKIALKAELYQKGINRDLIEEVLGETNKESEEILAIKAIEKKMSKLFSSKTRIWKNLSPLEFRKKAYEFLLRRGFEYDVVREVVENILKKR